MRGEPKRCRSEGTNVGRGRRSVYLQNFWPCVVSAAWTSAEETHARSGLDALASGARQAALAGVADRRRRVASSISRTGDGTNVADLRRSANVVGREHRTRPQLRGSKAVLMHWQDLLLQIGLAWTVRVDYGGR